MIKQILLGFLATIAIVLLPIFLSRQLVSTQASPESAPPINISPVPTITSLKWKDYHNSDFFYSLSFPPYFAVEDWNIETASRIKNQNEGYLSQQVRLKSGEDFFEVLVWVNKNQTAVPQFLRWYRHEDLNLKLIPDQANFHLSGQRGFAFTQEETSRGKLNYLFVNYAEYLYEIVYPSRQTGESFYLQMLSNFNFLPN